MMRRPKMRARVLVLRVVATADVPAAKAQPQMHPAVAGAQALFAAVGARRHGTNLIEMRATIHWRFPVLSIFYWSARGRYSSDATTVALSRRSLVLGEPHAESAHACTRTCCHDEARRRIARQGGGNRIARRRRCVALVTDYRRCRRAAASAVRHHRGSSRESARDARGGRHPGPGVVALLPRARG